VESVLVTSIEQSAAIQGGTFEDEDGGDVVVVEIVVMEAG
jgi:hypothetical protein